ncbi:MAG TPA: type II secretion system minor pseudopilin GspK, partial [Gammaproteobacteria bacterium]|nr:type II secretion system minor pseudopilin GspK [Gammaproteobacteria bacterium]
MTGRQRGVALVTALLVVALATVAAVAMATRQQVDIRRTANLLAGDQGRLYAEGVEAWAAQVLRRDREDGDTDAEGEQWATVLPPITVEGGEITGRIEDMQGRFNLNNLVNPEGAPRPPQVARLRRLLAAVELSPGLAEAVVDWLDADIEPRFPDGAEDAAYLNRDPAYRTANVPVAHPAELRQVAGFDAAAYRALAPYVTALPATTTINCNTAKPPVLQALADGVTRAEAEAVVEARGDDGFDSAGECLAEPAFAARDV